MLHKYTLCPVCSSKAIEPVMDLQDHSITGESFSIWECGDCQLRFTQDVPDKDHIAPYYRSENYISHSNSSRGLVNKIYRLVRKRALKQKRKLVEHLTGRKKGNLLEVGAGTGAFAAEMREHGWNVKALEPDEGARRLALRERKLELEEPAILYSLQGETFDAIVLWHVLEHVHDLHSYVRKFREVLKADGKLLIAVPNYTSYDAAVYGKNWAAYDVPRHLYHFHPGAMRHLLELHDLKLQDTRPMWFDSFYVSILSSKYQTGATNWLHAIWTGMVSNLKALDKKENCSSLIYIAGK